MNVEFLGVPRQRAGITHIEIQAGTLGQLLGSLAVQVPSLADVISGDRLHSAFTANLNGDRLLSPRRRVDGNRGAGAAF